MPEYPLDEMADAVSAIRKSAEKLKSISAGIKAVDRNSDRLLASVKMLELNISEIRDIMGRKEDRRRQR